MFEVFYLIVQGYPLSHGNISITSAHTLDNLIAALVALPAIAFNVLGLCIVIAVMTMLVVVYDLWILGGAAANINRLTDEYRL